MGWFLWFLIKLDVIIECLNSSPNAVDNLGMTTCLGKVHGVWHIHFGGVCDVGADSFYLWRSRAFHIRRVCDFLVRFLTPGVLIACRNFRADFSSSNRRHARLKCSSNGDGYSCSIAPAFSLRECLCELFFKCTSNSTFSIVIHDFTNHLWWFALDFTCVKVKVNLFNNPRNWISPSTPLFPRARSCSIASEDISTIIHNKSVEMGTL